jgi:hypothetical protein
MRFAERKLSRLACMAFGLLPISQAPAVEHILTWNGTGWSGGWTSSDFPTNSSSDTYALDVAAGSPANSVATIFSPDLGPVTTVTDDSLDIGAGNEFEYTGYNTSTITLTSGLTVNGLLDFNAGGVLNLPSGVGLSGTGTVQADSGGAIITSGGGTFTIGPSMLAQTKIAGGEFQMTPGLDLGNTSSPFDNQGTVNCAAGFITLNGSSFSNEGSISVATGGTVSFNAPFNSIASLGKISATGTGTFDIAGTFNNTGQTFNVDNTLPGNWQFGGTIKGGTIQTGDGKSLTVSFPLSLSGSAILDGVTINGTLNVEGPLKVQNSTPLAGTGTIYLSNSLTSNDSSLEIGSGLTVDDIGPGLNVDDNRGVSSYLGTPAQLGDVSRPTVNQGTVIADDSYLDISGSTFSNTGMIKSINGGILGINADFHLSDLGTFVNQGSISIDGTLENAGQTLTISSTTGGYQLQGTVRGGTIQTLGGNSLLIPANATGTFDNVQLNGDVYSVGSIQIPTGESLSGSATITFPSTSEFAGVQGTGGLTIQSGITIHSQGYIINVGVPASPTTNFGTIDSDGSDAITGFLGTTLNNQGTLEATNGGVLGIQGSDPSTGTYTMAEVGKIVNNGGLVVYFGTLDNTGQTFVVNSTTGATELLGTLKNGTLSTAPGSELAIDNFGTDFINVGGARLDPILDNVVFNGATVDLYSRNFPLTCTQPLTGTGLVELNIGTLLFTCPTSTIGSGITVTGQQDVTIGDSTRPLLNQGVLDPGAGATIIGTTITNQGTIHLHGQYDIVMQGNFQAGANSTMDAQIAPPFNPGYAGDLYLTVKGNLDLSGSNDYLNLTADPLSPPALNTPYLFATYTGTLTGKFANVTPGFTLDYSTPGEIFVTVVPEPASASLALLSLAGLYLRNRGKIRSSDPLT